MSTNVVKVHEDAAVSAARRVENARDQMRKIGNMRGWALTRAEREQGIGKAYQSMADTLLNTPKAERKPFAFR